MAQLHKVQGLVYQALTEKPETRADNFLLILEVYGKLINEHMSLKTVLENHTLLGLPSIESITRARRKLQEKYPELKTPAAVAIRAGEEAEYRAYAINN